MMELSSELGGSLITGAIALLALWVGQRSRFFTIPQDPVWKPPVLLWQVIVVFAIYFGVALFIAPAVAKILKPLFQGGSTGINYLSWLNLITSCTIMGGLLLFYKQALPTEVQKNVWKSPHLSTSYLDDAKGGFYCWLIAFPLVLSISQLLDIIVYLLFKIPKLPDQIAVYFVKMTFSHPLYFAMAILTIVFLAPLIEEILFRGFLQTFIHKHLGSKQAILITSVCFSFFHYSSEQGLANIPIVGSLFSLALFLGFIYEKKRSLFAPISLHAIFNGISILNLYFLEGIPHGAL
jgi:hypothetical protein